jgi:hypothetical protein
MLTPAALAKAALAVALLFQSGSGLGFAEALARAQRYEDDAKAQVYRDGPLKTALAGPIQSIFARCYPDSDRRTLNFSLVLSFKAGAFDRVESNSDDRVADCMTRAFSGLSYGKPPYEDFAEEIHMELRR